MLYFFVRLPGDGPLWTETLGILFDVIVEISNEQVCAFYWFRTLFYWGHPVVLSNINIK